MARTTKTARPESPRDQEVLHLPTAAGRLPTVQLPTTAHYGLVRRAVTDLALDLDKVAKATAAAGYAKASREISADAKALREEIEPRFAAQAELALATEGDVRAQIMSHLAGAVNPRIQAAERQAVKLVDPTTTSADGKKDHARLLLEDLAERVSAFALAIAEDAFQAGLRARSETAPEFAARAMARLRAPATP